MEEQIIAELVSGYCLSSFLGLQGQDGYRRPHSKAAMLIRKDVRGKLCCQGLMCLFGCLDALVWHSNRGIHLHRNKTFFGLFFFFFLICWVKLEELLYLCKVLQVGIPDPTLKSSLVFFYLTPDVLSLQKTWGKQSPLLVMGVLSSSMTWMMLYSLRNT